MKTLYSLKNIMDFGLKMCQYSYISDISVSKCFNYSVNNIYLLRILEQFGTENYT